MLAYQEHHVEAAYAAHRGRLVRHLTVITRNPATAEDLAQEAFLRLAREVEAGRTPQNTGAWLYRVGANLAMSHARHAQVALRHDALLPTAPEAPNPERVFVERELTAEVVEMLAEMSDAERRALVLAAYGFGSDEIATSLGRSPGATRTLLCRARAKIRERFAVAGFAPA